MNGRVLRLGWDDRFIVAERGATFGDNVAWMVLDTEKEALDGPFTDEQFARKRGASFHLARIEIVEAASAWEAFNDVP